MKGSIMITLQSILREWRNQQLADSKICDIGLHKKKVNHLPVYRQYPDISKRLGLRKGI